MFQIEYTYKKKDGKEYKSKYPDDKDINKNIFILSGSNDLGKSTTMQIIAYGLYGLDNEDIKKEIKAKIRRLISEDTEIFQYNFKIKSLDGTISLESDNKIPTKEVRLLLNREYINSSAFEKKFKLIFDVPEETPKKLLDSLKSIKELIEDADKKLQGYRDYINTLRDNLVVEEKNQKSLNETIEKLHKFENELKNTNERFEQVTKDFKKYDSMRIIKKYLELKNEIEEKQNKLNEIQKEKNKYEKRIASIPQNLENFRNNFDLFKQDIKELLNRISQISSELDEKNMLDNFEKECENFIKDDDPNHFNEKKFENIYNIIINLEMAIKNTYNKKSEISKLQDEYKFLNELKEILKKYVKVNPEIPGTNGKYLNQFLNEVELKIENLKGFVENKHLQSLENILTIIERLKTNYQSLKYAWNKLKNKNLKNNSDENFNVSQNIEIIQKELEAKKKDFENVRSDYQALSDEQKKIKQEDLINLYDENKYNELNEEYQTRKNQIEDLKVSINSVKSTIKIYEDKIKNEISENIKFTKEELEKKLEIVDNQLRRKLRDWKKWIQEIDLENPKKDITEVEKSKFYSVIGKYLARIVEYIHFEDKRWNLEEIDLINYIYIVKEGPPIKFVDIGTGHTSLNSLMAKIKQDYGDRKKILLFDDIGLMDNKNVERLEEEIKNQVRVGNVILAILSIAERNQPYVKVEGIDVNERGKNL